MGEWWGGPGGKGRQGVTADGHRVSFLVMKTLWNQTRAVFAQLYKDTKNHQSVLFARVNLTVRELDLNTETEEQLGGVRNTET